MKQDFPFLFSACQLRVSSQFGWIHAIGAYANGVRKLREANLFGWFYARSRCRIGGDNAGFHAIGTIEGIDGQPTFIAIENEKYEYIYQFSGRSNSERRHKVCLEQLSPCLYFEPINKLLKQSHQNNYEFRTYQCLQDRQEI